MNININRIIKPWYFAGFATFMACFIGVLFVIQRIELKHEIGNLRHQYDKLEEDIIVTERDNQLKTITMYNLIISTYGNKYNKKYNRLKLRKYQGLETRWQQALFVRKCYEYERRAHIPYATLVTTAKEETYFNPFAETRYELSEPDKKKGRKKGRLKEAGIFQNRRSAVGQAALFLIEMRSINPKLAEDLQFDFKDMTSLFDPLNALKIETLLYWGYMRMTGNQQAWYVLLVHWGMTKIMPYYYGRKNNGILPDSFSFNLKTIKEDVRDPLHYFGKWYANWGRFSKFKIKVGVERWYDRIYKKERSKVSWEYIQGWKFVRTLKNDIKDLKKYRIEVKKEDAKRLNKIFKSAKNADKEFLKIKGIIRSGGFLHINDVLRMWKIHFKKLIKDLGYEKKTSIKIGKREIQFDKTVIILYLIFMGSLLLLALFGFGIIAKRVTKKIIKKVRKKRACNKNKSRI